jgi:hypothetical protein
MLLVLLVGLTLSNLIGLAIYSGERHLALTTQSGRNVAEPIATATAAFDEGKRGFRRGSDLARRPDAQRDQQRHRRFSHGADPHLAAGHRDPG